MSKSKRKQFREHRIDNAEIINSVVEEDDQELTVVTGNDDGTVNAISAEQDLGHDRLFDALMYVQDLFDRVFIPFIILGDTAKAVKEQDDPKLHGSYLEFAIVAKDLARSKIDMLFTLAKTDTNVKDIKVTETEIYINYRDVPIHATLVDSRYPFFDKPDTRFFYAVELKLPNPFNEYWEVRHEI